MLFHCREVYTNKSFSLKSPFLIEKKSVIEYREKTLKVLDVEKYNFNTDGILESIDLKVSIIKE